METNKRSLDGSPDKDRSFLVQCLLTQFYLYEMAGNISSKQQTTSIWKHVQMSQIWSIVCQRNSVHSHGEKMGLPRLTQMFGDQLSLMTPKPAAWTATFGIPTCRLKSKVNHISRENSSPHLAASETSFSKKLAKQLKKKVRGLFIVAWEHGDKVPEQQI